MKPFWTVSKRKGTVFMYVKSKIKVLIFQDMKDRLILILIVTARVRSTRECNVFTLFQFTGGGNPSLWSQVPSEGGSEREAVPDQDQQKAPSNPPCPWPGPGQGIPPPHPPDTTCHGQDTPRIRAVAVTQEDCLVTFYWFQSSINF